MLITHTWDDTWASPEEAWQIFASLMHRLQTSTIEAATITTRAPIKDFSEPAQSRLWFDDHASLLSFAPQLPEHFWIQAKDRIHRRDITLEQKGDLHTLIIPVQDHPDRLHSFTGPFVQDIAPHISLRPKRLKSLLHAWSQNPTTPAPLTSLLSSRVHAEVSCTTKDVGRHSVIDDWKLSSKQHSLLSLWCDLQTKVMGQQTAMVMVKGLFEIQGEVSMSYVHQCENISAEALTPHLQQNVTQLDLLAEGMRDDVEISMLLKINEQNHHELRLIASSDDDSKDLEVLVERLEDET